MFMDFTLSQFAFSLHGASNFLDAFAVFLAKYLPYLLVLGSVYFIYKSETFKKKFEIFINLALTEILARGIITEVIRYFYARPRPFAEFGIPSLIPQSGNSFPSGHATFFFSLAIIIFYFNRKWGNWFLVAAILNGLARIYVGVHYPSDILGGAGISLVSFYIIYKLLKPLSLEEKTSSGIISRE